MIKDYDWIKLNCAISNAVYQDNFEPVMGWKRIYNSDIKESGYYGSIFVDNDNYPFKAIIAHRGSNSIKDYIEDISILKKQTFNQINDAYNFVYKDFTNIMEERYGNSLMQTSQTGHSLGAILADVSSIHDPIEDAKYWHPIRSSVTFENPGSKEIIYAWLKQLSKRPGRSNFDPDIIMDIVLRDFAPNCIVIQSHVNFINTCNTQLGVVHRLIDKPYDLSDMPDFILRSPYLISSQAKGNMYYLIQNMLNQHAILPILDYINLGGHIIESESPVGLQEGYRYFLDYRKNPLFWDEFFKMAWELSLQDPFCPHEPTEEVLKMKGLAALNTAREKSFFPQNFRFSGGFLTDSGSLKYEAVSNIFFPGLKSNETPRLGFDKANTPSCKIM